MNQVVLGVAIIFSLVIFSGTIVKANDINIDIRPLLKDIRKIEGLKPLPIAGRKRSIISASDQRKIDTAKNSFKSPKTK